MSEYNDIAGSDDIISLNLESQETFNDHSYRTKQSTSRLEKIASVKDQAKENQKPAEEVATVESDVMQAETQSYSQTIVENGAGGEQPTVVDETQNGLPSENPHVVEPSIVKPTLTDGSDISTDKDSLAVPSATQEENDAAAKPAEKAAGLDVSTTANNIRLYISPCTSLLDNTNIDDAQPDPLNSLTTNGVEQQHPPADEKPKEEPMDTSDAQVSLGSDGIIESHPTPAVVNESNSTAEKSMNATPSPRTKATISNNVKALYAFSQPTTEKFEDILAKLTKPIATHEAETNFVVREEEEYFIRESVSKTLRRYAVKLDPNGRVLARDLLSARVVEENITTRIEPVSGPEKPVAQPAVIELEVIQPPTEPTRPVENGRAKPSKPKAPKRRTKSLKPTPTAASPKKAKAARSMSDDDDVIHIDDDDESSDDDNDDDDDDGPSDDVTGDEFVPPTVSSQSLKKGSRLFAKWHDGNFYPGLVSYVSGEKYMIEYDDGAKRQVKSQDIICQSYLEPNQSARAQIKDGCFETAIVKRLIQKKKTGSLGYVVEIDGKEKWYPLQFISLTPKQAQQLPTVNSNQSEEAAPAAQGKRKRTSTVPQSPNKKTKNSGSASPMKNQRTTSTPPRQTKLFNSKHFLLTGFNDSIEVRVEIQAAIESHGGRVIEKMPKANRRENTFLISDKARRTAKFFDAKKLEIPCVKYQWINDSIEKGELQEWNDYELFLTEKGAKTSEDNED